MMGYESFMGGGYGGLFGGLGQLVWLVAGVLLIVWLWKQINKA